MSAPAAWPLRRSLSAPRSSSWSSTSSPIASSPAPACGEEIALALRTVDGCRLLRRVMGLLTALGIAVAINEHAERGARIRSLSRWTATHAAYDGVPRSASGGRSFRPTACFKLFRSGFLGKASPVHFFWGSFDLAVTRFSGRRAPLHPGGIPGAAGRGHARGLFARGEQRRLLAGQRCVPAGGLLLLRLPRAAGLPRPPGAARAACFEPQLNEFILPYDAVRAAARPRRVAVGFPAAPPTPPPPTLRGWDRAALECAIGVPAKVRPM